MATFKVNVNKLNLRSGPVQDFANKGNVVGVLSKDALFECVRVVENELGRWCVGKDGHFVSEKWLGNISTTGIFEGKKTFSWFDNLKIAETWEKYSERGSLSTVAILDTGYNINNTDIKDSIEKCSILIDNVNYDKEQLIIEDRSTIGHGSRCASLAGGRNKLQFIVGVAPESKILIGKISINRELRDFDYILKGIEWAIQEGADVISISYACPFTDKEFTFYSKKFEELVKDKNILIFASSGNSNGLKKEERYPASFANCISIGSVDENRSISSFTILSDKTILHAIGNDIESYGKTNVPDVQSGTSYSTPIIAGISALAISYLRRQGKEINSKLLFEKLIGTGDPIINTDKKKIINVEKLFEQL